MKVEEIQDHQCFIIIDDINDNSSTVTVYRKGGGMHPLVFKLQKDPLRTDAYNFTVIFYGGWESFLDSHPNTTVKLVSHT